MPRTGLSSCGNTESKIELTEMTCANEDAECNESNIVEQTVFTEELDHEEVGTADLKPEWSSKRYGNHVGHNAHGPHKSDVLKYIAKATQFRIKSVGSDIQVTDLCDNPLLDIWYQLNCTFRVWTVEAYGKAVLQVNDPLNVCDPFLQEGCIFVVDSSGDYLGYFVANDPYVVHNADNRPIARVIRPSEIAAAGAQKSADVNLTGEPPPLLSSDNNGSTSISLTCVSEPDSSCIASLDNNGILKYDARVGLQMKLLVLMAFVRLITEESSTLSVSCSMIKVFLGCCFRGY
ncbi:hypothetical protein TTRE_0000575201 [Trichuris trichiura]|uniref:Uncharacterized protein n=1 Tax=Trichuris trichiura TaxID=36087 RepID=A0A077ZFL6_TRITR|nr:hypothetical protein TTRE_0000575201 [Trichuris trichiura]